MEAKGSKIQAVEQKYGLDKYAKTEFIKHIIKEFVKIDDKLVRIAKYETMKKEELDKDKTDLLSRRDSIHSHLEGLKLALEVYKKAYGKGGEGATIPANLAAEPVKDNKAEIEAKVNEFITATAKKLGYLLIAASIVQDKERTSTNPLVYLSAGQQADLLKIYKEITHVHEEKDITLAEEANNAAEALLHFIKNEPHHGLEISNVSSTISNIMNDNSAIAKKFRMNAPKAAPMKEYGITQSISVGKDIPQEAPKKEIQQPVHEAAAPKKEEPVKPKEPEVPAPVQKPKEEPKQPERESNWGKEAEEEDEEGEYYEGEEEHEKPGYIPSAPAPIKEAEFEIATTKSEERKKRIEEGQRRGRGRGGRRGGRGGRRGGYGGYRGGRGPRRGRGESVPQSSAPVPSQL